MHSLFFINFIRQIGKLLTLLCPLLFLKQPEGILTEDNTGATIDPQGIYGEASDKITQVHGHPSFHRVHHYGVTGVV